MHLPEPRPAEQPLTLHALPLEDLAALRQSLGEAVEQAITRGVRWLRLSGASWTVVGRALGVTRQAAHEKYRHVDDFGFAFCLVDGTAFVRCEMTDVMYRDPSELEQRARLVIKAATSHALT